MVEFTRHAQVEELSAKGWTEDEECVRLAWADESCGGPTYMRAPDGRIYTVFCGQETPVNGLYPYWDARIPTDMPDHRAILASETEPVRPAFYRQGRVAAVRG